MPKPHRKAGERSETEGKPKDRYGVKNRYCHKDKDDCTIAGIGEGFKRRKQSRRWIRIRKTIQAPGQGSRWWRRR